MKWILHRIRGLTAVPSQQASSQEPPTPVPNSQALASSLGHVERKVLGVETSLKDIPGVTDQMLVAFGEHGVASIEDLAACATDDLDGWSESKDGNTIRHAGILAHLGLSREGL
jgi:hypothetical protein